MFFSHPYTTVGYLLASFLALLGFENKAFVEQELEVP